MTMWRKVIFSSIAVLIIGTAFLLLRKYYFDYRVTEKKFSGQVEDVRLGAYLGEFSSLIWIAEDIGCFEEFGLNVEVQEYESGVAPMQDMLAGELDIVTSGEFVAVSHIFDHPDIQIFSIIQKGDAIELIAKAGQDIDEIKDLIGKRVGLVRNSQADFFFGKLVASHGVNYQDVEIVDLAPSEMAAALEVGQVDAVMVWEPYVYDLIEQFGSDVISWPGQNSQEFFFVLSSTKQLLADRPHVAARLLAALVEAERYLNAWPEEAKEIIAKRIRQDREYLDYTWEKNEFLISLEQGIFPSMEDEARWMIANGLTDQTRVPNYLENINIDILLSVQPTAVNIIQ